MPFVAPPNIASIDDLGHRDDGITLVTARFGYMQRTHVPDVLAALPQDQFESAIDLARASYFLSTISSKSASARA